MKYTDQEIIDAIRGEDRTANRMLEYLLQAEEWKRAVRAQLSNYAYDEEDFRSVLLESMFTFYRKIMSGDFQYKSALKTYFIGIAKNCISNHFRKKKGFTELKEGVLVREGYIPGIHAKLNEEDIQSLLENLFGEVNEDCRKMGILRWYDYPHADVATYMGLKNDRQSRKKMDRCKKKLQQIITDRKIDLRRILYGK